MDCLALTNEALRESGITLDSLTTSNFETPPDPMYTKFKQWTLQSWEDIQLARRDWEFMQATGVTLCNPKMEVYGCYSTTTPTVSDFTSTTFKLHNSANADLFVSGTLSGTYATDALVTAGTAEGSLTISSITSGLEDFLIEPGDMLTNSSGSVLCFFQRWGRYDLSQSATIGRNTSADIAELKLDSLAVADVQFGVDQSYTSTTYSKLKYVSYGDWLKKGYDRPKTLGKPTHFTLSNNGQIEFYPPLDTTYNIYFEYTKTPQSFTMTGTGSDTPTDLPTRFHKAISWRAVMYWAEYEGQAQQYARAESRYKKFESDMIRDLLPPVQIKGGTF